MPFNLLRSLMASVVLALAALTWPAPTQAQVHVQARLPLPLEFLATLKNIEVSFDEIADSVTAIKKADLNYAMFAGGRVYDSIARLEKLLPALKTQSTDLRREESLRMLLSARTTFSDARRNVGSISDILHNARVRSEADADTLNKLLAWFDGAIARLDATLKQFDSGVMTLTSSAPAPAPVLPAPALAAATSGPATVASAPASAVATPIAAAAQVPQSLPPEFLVALANIETAGDDISTSVMAIKNADLTYSILSRSRVNDALARVQKQLPALKTQIASLRRGGSLGILLSSRTIFSEVQRYVGSLSDSLHDATVRSPSELDILKKWLTQLDSTIARLDAALKQFDSIAMVLLDKPTTASPIP